MWVCKVHDIVFSAKRYRTIGSDLFIHLGKETNKNLLN